MMELLLTGICLNLCRSGCLVVACAHDSVCDEQFMSACGMTPAPLTLSYQMHWLGGDPAQFGVVYQCSESDCAFVRCFLCLSLPHSAVSSNAAGRDGT